LINVDYIASIEVEYALPDGTGYVKQPLASGCEDPNAVRFFRFSVNGENFLLPANPDDPVMEVFDRIYKAAIKGVEPELG
jgi:hypothetical protein